MRNLRTLVLSKNYMPVSAFPSLYCISAQDAVKKYLDEKHEVLCFYDDPILFKGEPIDHPEKGILYWPSVIVDRKQKIKDTVRMSRNVLYYREERSCYWCGNEIQNIAEVTKDHIVPTSKGGSNTFENVVCSCRKCNAEKGDTLPVGKWKPKYLPKKPTFFELLDKRAKYPMVVDDPQWVQFLPNFAAENIILKE